MGGKEWIPAYADVVVNNESELKIGSLRLKPIHTPGHTPEHIIWVCYDDSRNAEIPWFAFTGDCLFVGSVGRPDILGKEAMQGMARQLYHTLFSVMGTMPDFLEIYPAHGQGSLCGKSLNSRGTSSLGYERICNPYLKRDTEEKWIETAFRDLLPIPPYFQRLKKLNVKGAPLLSTLKSGKWISTPSLNQLFLIDIRLPDLFAASHLRGSINIPAAHNFSTWAGWMIPENEPIGLIVESSHAAAEIIELLREMGFDQEIFIIHFSELELSKYSLVSFPMMEPKDAAQSSSLLIVDVRTSDEWAEGHIAEAHHVDLLDLKKEELPQDKTIALICKSGNRASLAASLLENLGYKVANIQNGMQGWISAGLPVKKSKVI
jgi:hydroxyacylglutathione hydrolase